MTQETLKHKNNQNNTLITDWVSKAPDIHTDIDNTNTANNWATKTTNTGNKNINTDTVDTAKPNRYNKNKIEDPIVNYNKNPVVNSNTNNNSERAKQVNAELHEIDWDLIYFSSPRCIASVK